MNRRGFSLTELLVVISIIVVLVGLLLVALRGAREAGRESGTRATMVAFAAACDAFHADHGFYPGVVPEDVLAANNHTIIHGDAGVAIAGTENALLHLQGGAISQDDTSPQQWSALTSSAGWSEYTILRNVGTLQIKINRSQFGLGPTIGGKAFGPYFAGRDSVRASPAAQWPGDRGGGGGDDGEFAGGGAPDLPDLLDAWGNPILYFRQTRTIGKLVWDAHAAIDPPQYYVDTNWPYTRAPSQIWDDPCDGGDGGSLLNSNYFTGIGGIDPSITRRVLAAIVRSPASTVDPTNPLVPGQARSAYTLISAGSDGVYFASDDGPGTPTRHIGAACGDPSALSIDEFLQLGPTVFEQFDDLVHYGGSM